MKTGILKDGLKNNSPKACDASTKLPTTTKVDSDTTRTSVGKATNNIGPREA
jgi:hypothetical protein